MSRSNNAPQLRRNDGGARDRSLPGVAERSSSRLDLKFDSIDSA